MSVSNRLVFDVTDAATISASSSVGAFVRSSDGTLIGNVSDALKVSLTNTSLAVTASDLDIRDLAYATDSVTAHQGGTWNVGTVSTITNVVHVDDNSGSLTVDASNLDIRDLAAASDSVASWLKDGSGNSISSTTGWLDVNIKGGSIDVQNEADTALESTAKSVSTTGALLAAQLTGRKFMFVQNLGNKQVYVGKSGVTTSNGLQLSPGMIFEFQLGPSVSMHAVSEAGSQDVRILEAA